MYIYIACSPCCCYYYDSSFTNLLIANINSFSDLDDLVYTILGIPTIPPALAPTPAKPAKIMPAIRRTAARKAKRRKSAKAYTIVGRVAAAKRSKKEGLQRSKRTTGGDAGRNTTNSGLTANKDDNNAYNRAYVPFTDIEEEEGSSSDNNSVNSSTSDSAGKGKGSSACKCGKGTLYCEDTLLYK
ncbi:hypothetical protein P8C59_003169 [Phyllachora maydis]|uniref:Uncharacterized protein n=1 Tax=Phyllachora maydis TaxID=1825666 RepID=A0AAD9MB65_9PEZI|nr:hypothetical protein P8C59_003169 [Phyllachora maydis]